MWVGENQGLPGRQQASVWPRPVDASSIALTLVISIPASDARSNAVIAGGSAAMMILSTMNGGAVSKLNQNARTLHLHPAAHHFTYVYARHLDTVTTQRPLSREARSMEHGQPSREHDLGPLETDCQATPATLVT